MRERERRNTDKVTEIRVVSEENHNKQNEQRWRGRERVCEEDEDLVEVYISSGIEMVWKVLGVKIFKFRNVFWSTAKILTLALKEGGIFVDRIYGVGVIWTVGLLYTFHMKSTFFCFRHFRLAKVKVANTSDQLYVSFFFSIEFLFNESQKARTAYKAKPFKGPTQNNRQTSGPKQNHRPKGERDVGRLHRETTASPPFWLSPENHPTIHRATPELINSTPTSPRPPTSQVRLISERINRKRDLIRHSSTQTPRRKLRSNITLSTGDLPSSSDEISPHKPEPNPLTNKTQKRRKKNRTKP